MAPEVSHTVESSRAEGEQANYAGMMSNFVTGKPVEIAPGLALLQLSLVNVYFVGMPGAADRNWVLVDAALSFSAPWIRKAAAERFGPESRPAAIILTHGHFDHVGALKDLADDWDVPIYAHPLEMPYITGRSSYPPADPAVGGGAMAFLSRLYPRGPINVSDRVRELPRDGSVPYMPGWRWIPTPGHSPGHVSFFRDADRALIAGDAFVTMKQESLFGVLTRDRQVRRPPAYYTVDWHQSFVSVERLARLEPEVAATGHGIPMFGPEMRRQLWNLVQSWEHNAVPSYGRYVRRPAVMDQNGVVSVPPPVLDRNFWAFANVGLMIGLAALLMKE